MGWYIDEKSEPQFPFGFGLSYTTFKYDNLKITPPHGSASATFTVEIQITNTGSRAGDEAWRDRHSARVDLALGVERPEIAGEPNPVADDSDVADERRAAEPVVDGAAADDDIIDSCLRARRYAGDSGKKKRAEKFVDHRVATANIVAFRAAVNQYLTS